MLAGYIIMVLLCIIGWQTIFISAFVEKNLRLRNELELYHRFLGSITEESTFEKILNNAYSWLADEPPIDQGGPPPNE
jgi:hypothetical protein